MVVLKYALALAEVGKSAEGLSPCPDIYLRNQGLIWPPFEGGKFSYLGGAVEFELALSRPPNPFHYY